MDGFAGKKIPSSPGFKWMIFQGAKRIGSVGGQIETGAGHPGS
jgi:hypothetical protein